MKLVIIKMMMTMKREKMEDEERDDSDIQMYTD